MFLTYSNSLKVNFHLNEYLIILFPRIHYCDLAEFYCELKKFISYFKFLVLFEWLEAYYERFSFVEYANTNNLHAHIEVRKTFISFFLVLYFLTPSDIGNQVVKTFKFLCESCRSCLNYK